MNDQRGFTLIEVILALLLFSIMVGGLMSAGLVASDQIREGQGDVRVWEIATYQMETLIAMGYDNVSNGKDTIQGHPVDWKITGNSPKTITVTVDKKSYKGKEKKAQSFITYLADPADL